MNRKGFTLVEIIVALGILAVGLASVFGMFTAATTLHKRAVDGMTSAFIAEKAFAELRDYLGATGRVQHSMNGSFTDYPGYGFNIRLTRVDMCGTEFLAECEVTWRDRGIRHADTFHTIVRRRVLYNERKRAIGQCRTNGQ